jgi:hypothetical protein
MRPIYETEKDLRNEVTLSDLVSERWKCSMQKLQPRDRFDYAAVRSGKVMSFIEMKTRTNPMMKYPTYMISMTKVINAKITNMATGIPCFLIVKWSDYAGYVSIDNIETTVTMGGRTDRSDPQDVEPVCHINLSYFKKFN